MNMNRRDALAPDVNLEEITSSKQNAEVMRRLRDNIRWEGNTLCITEGVDDDNDDDDNDDNEEMVFSIREGDDLSWLGYFIGRNQSLDDLSVEFMPEERERVDAFIDGVSHNRSMRELAALAGTDIRVRKLYPFFRENNNLTKICLYHAVIGRECASDLALALSQRQVKSLTAFCLRDNNLGDEGFADIVQALGTQPQLEQLICPRNNIGRISCEALGALMMIWRMSNLKYLHLPNNSIDDAGLQALVPGLCNSSNLEQLSISDPITAVGLRYLSPFLQSGSCRLRFLNIRSVRFGDAEAAALAYALSGNKSLTTFCLPNQEYEDEECAITEAGWSAFSKLLCDTSSINNTYLSNHTLTYIIENSMDDTHIADLLKMNEAAKNMRNREIAMQSLTRSKILMSHPDLDMEPLFLYKLKFLPLITNWFRRSIQLCSDEVGRWKESVPKMQSRELSAVYKFVRGMPLLASDGYWTNVLNDSQAEKRKLQMMLKRAEENERCALKRLRR
mmetsp:Transcript_2010/g.3123  ORF Transcript_2010/g.3123 Transcript_2010/m.3123 type:complete len:505 (-) Transcript_2010:60-1574(-)